MGEWTGVRDLEAIEAIREALHSTLPGMLEELVTLESAENEDSSSD
jgi:hypothetical protein